MTTYSGSPSGSTSSRTRCLPRRENPRTSHPAAAPTGGSNVLRALIAATSIRATRRPAVRTVSASARAVTSGSSGTALRVARCRCAGDARGPRGPTSALLRRPGVRGLPSPRVKEITMWFHAQCRHTSTTYTRNRPCSWAIDGQLGLRPGRAAERAELRPVHPGDLDELGPAAHRAAPAGGLAVVLGGAQQPRVGVAVVAVEGPTAAHRLQRRAPGQGEGDDVARGLGVVDDLGGELVGMRGRGLGRRGRAGAPDRRRARARPSHKGRPGARGAHPSSRSVARTRSSRP